MSWCSVLPVIRGPKKMLNFGRDHSVVDGLNCAATWNMMMPISVDLIVPMRALREKRKPEFDD